jgi:hypothetical protein
MLNRTPIPRDQRRLDLSFDPVPRKPRHDGWTPERQKAFIEALADTGCVSRAARMVNMSPESAYLLRRQPGAESFRRAWDAALDFGVARLKDIAFERAIEGQLVPVFVAGKLMGFRRKKNDRLLMFCLRHYGQDKDGRRITVNYFSSRASAGIPPRNGEGDPPQQNAKAGGGGPETRSTALAAAESSTTTVKTIITGGAGDALSRLEADDRAAAILGAFEGVPLDEAAQADIYRALEACAERRRAAPIEEDPDEPFVRVAPGDVRWLGELESGVGGDCVEYRPEGEHAWEGLGEGGQAAEIDKVLAGIAEREAKRTPEEEAAEPAAPEAAPQADAPDAPISPRTGKPVKRYKKRQPKPPFNWPVLSEGEGPPEGTVTS